MGSAQSLTADLQANRVTDLIIKPEDLKPGDVPELAKALRENKSVLILELKDHAQLPEVAIQELVSVLRVNKTITTLRLEKMNISDNVARDLGGILANNTALTTILLKENKIKDEGAIALSRGLSNNTTLTSLFLNGNEIGEAGAEAFLTLLKSNATLTTLDLKVNKIPRKKLEEVENQLRVNARARETRTAGGVPVAAAAAGTGAVLAATPLAAAAATATSAPAVAAAATGPTAEVQARRIETLQGQMRILYTTHAAHEDEIRRLTEALAAAEERAATLAQQLQSQTTVRTDLQTEVDRLTASQAVANEEMLRRSEEKNSNLVAILDKVCDDGAGIVRLAEAALEHDRDQLLATAAHLNLAGTKLQDYEVVRRLGAVVDGDQPSPNRFNGVTSAAYEVRRRLPPGHPQPRLCMKVAYHLMRSDEKSVESVQSRRIREKLQHEWNFICDTRDSFLRAHPGVVLGLHNFVDVATADRLPNWFVDRDYHYDATLFVVMEMKPMSLRQLITQRQHALRNPPFFGKKRFLSIVASMLVVLRHIGRGGVVHCDMKADNILTGNVFVNDIGNQLSPVCVQLADFGEARRIFSDDLTIQFVDSTITRPGAAAFQPPEIALAVAGPHAQLDYSKSDVYGAGIIAYEMLCGRDSPFDNVNAQEHPGASVPNYSQATFSPQTYVAPPADCYDEDVRTLVWRMVHPAVEQRFSADQALQFIQDLQTL